MCRSSGGILTVRRLAGLGLALLVLALGIQTAGADQDPAGCLDSRLTLTLGKDVSQVLVGDVVRYDLVMFTVQVGTPCDISLDEIRFLCPDANGVPDVGNVRTIASNLRFESDGSADRTYAHDTCSFGTEIGQPCDSSNPADAGTIACEAGGGVCPNLECVITGFDGNMEALARAETDGIVHDSPADTTQADDSDELAVTVLVCDVEIDKQVSCDGTNFHDVAFNPPSDGINGCSSWNAYDSDGVGGNDMSAEPLDVKYIVRNTGTATLSDCVLSDTNSALIGNTPLANIDPGNMDTTDVPGFCSDPLDDLEPDTGTVNCNCEVPGDPTPFVQPVQASDEATFSCLTPDLTITNLECVEDGGNRKNVTVQNTGSASLINCTIEDTSYDEFQCTGNGTPEFSGPLPDLGPGDSADVSELISAAALSNHVKVTCQIDDGTGSAVIDPQTQQPKTIMREGCADCPVCPEPTLDKQVSCDGGVTWHDVTGDDDADGGDIEGCVGWSELTPLPDGGVTVPAEPLWVRYKITNPSATTAYSCTLTESNSEIDADGVVMGGMPHPNGFDLAPGAMPMIVDMDQVCSDSLDDEEPNTATLSCFCTDELDDLDKTDTQVDVADFACQAPGLRVSKVCEQQADDVNNFNILVENLGDADLVDCTVVDQVELDDPSCSLDGTLTDVDVVPADFDLPAGNSQNVTGQIAGLLSNACNNVTVECTVVGSGGKTIEASDDTICTVPGGCLTRTPGFWGTHPHVTIEFLPLESCGIVLDNTDHGEDDSATEDMCFSGRDFKAEQTSPQQLQLIRQCMAANLNLAATAASPDGGDCEGDLPGIGDLIQACCVELCNSGAGGTEISEEGCIDQLDNFNNLGDTIDPYGPFVMPGPALPEDCRRANGNGHVNVCQDGDTNAACRDLGPRK